MMIHNVEEKLLELMKIVKMFDEDGEKISKNLQTFVELYVRSNSLPAERPISFVELLLDLWKFRIFAEFYYENMDRFYFNENLELFVDKMRMHREDGILFDPLRIISKETLGFTAAVKKLDNNSITIIENRGTRPDTNLNAKKVLVLTVSLVDCMISVKDESNLLNLTTFTSYPNSKFDSALSFFEDIAKSRALKDFQQNTRVCILFTKADLLMKRLEKFETFPRHEKEECKTIQRNEISNLRNFFMERNVINYVVNEFYEILRKSGMESIEFDYHIINALNEEEVNRAFELIVKPLNQRGVSKHYLSPCLYRPLEYIPIQLYNNLNNQYLTDVVIITNPSRNQSF
ncbi:predicted protein [Naegleria gruberi]|uniref:Predicted protein n=1 Tax=Naegleria gruberi TaxID=5762 RepID=D2VTR3_NAEGR|nr:uncharacterized protein NAEGRDRAFT_52181 [Naegleria gruberi]EFC39698.1 predicted protein [Naegleria gruberi]|eukprot:XP_002672442.1 predicted protein [Naegleria gruberi strain NEG-M]